MFESNPDKGGNGDMLLIWIALDQSFHTPCYREIGSWWCMTFLKYSFSLPNTKVELAQRPSLEMLHCRKLQKREIKHKQIQSIGQIGGSVIKMLASKPKDLSSILDPQGVVREPTPTSYPLTCIHGPWHAHEHHTHTHIHLHVPNR